MKRYELFDTVDGQFALYAFNKWRLFKKLPPAKIDVFTSSRYFKAFIRFAEYSRTQSIPDNLGFIRMMVEKGLSPFFWCDYDVYDSYVQRFDESYTIDMKVQISIDTLTEISETYQCTMGEVFDNIPLIDILKLITTRRLSPWLLLPSQKFKMLLMNRTSQEEQMLFSKFVDITKWRKEFEKNPDVLSTIKQLNATLGI
jgi:hypothetical protein